MCCHMSYSSGPYLPTEMGSSTATCPIAPDLTSLPRRAPVLPCVLWPQTLPPCQGGLWRYHVSYSSEPYHPAMEGSGIAACPMAPDPTSLLERAPALPRVPEVPCGPWASSI
jgi:hypothetical protein